VPPPVATLGQPSHRALEQAAEWYARLGSGEALEAERARWLDWLEHDPEHRLAWSYVESVSRRFAPLQSSPDPRRTADGLWEANARLRQRRQLLAGLVGLTGVGLLGSAAWRHTSLPLMAQAWRADIRTATGETRKVVLADGTRVWLNTATALNQDYSRRTRRLHLLTGEILVDTAADPMRPFMVGTPQGQLRALGTRFNVRLEGDQTLLSVYEGAVEVRTRQGAHITLQAAKQVRFSSDVVDAVELADPAREAWSRNVLMARDITLREVAAELRRYRHGHLGLAPEVAELRVFGSFPLSDTDATLDMLAAALPVRIRRTLPWWVSIEPEAG
jgi:transmembrane sensor